MALQTFQIKQLVGVDRNSVPGATEAPQELRSFTFRRGGGVEAGWGSRGVASSASVSGYAVRGYDESGLASVSKGGTIGVFDGDALHTTPFTTGAVTNQHVAGAGYFQGIVAGVGSSRAAYEVRLSDGSFRSTPGSASVSAVAVSGGSFSAKQYEVIAHTFLPTAAGSFTSLYSKKLVTTTGANASIRLSVSATPSGSITEVLVGNNTPPAAGSAANYDLVTAGLVAGTGSLTVSSLPAGELVGTNGTFMFLEPGSQMVPHQQRVYALASSTTFFTLGRGATATCGANSVVYSDLGYVHRADISNWFQVALKSGTVTGLASTPAGLLIFGENETYIMRGDPADVSNWSVSLVSAELGHDTGVGPPATIGGTTLCIYKGEVYRVTLGMGDVDLVGNVWKPAFENVSRPVWDGVDFIQVVAEPRLNQVVAMTADQHFFRFDLLTKQWLTDPFDGTLVTQMLPNPDGKGTRYLLGGSPEYVSSAASGCVVAWTGLDMGDRGLYKGWRRVRAYTSDGYSGTPTLTFSIGSSSGTVSATSRGSGEWVFTLPGGMVAPSADLTLALPGAVKGDTLKAPLEVEFAPRYRRR